MIRAVLFDLDGVMTLDETGTQSICNYICQTMGIDRGIFEREYRKYNADLLTGKIKHEDIWMNIYSAIRQETDIGILYDSFINTPINFKMLSLVKELKHNKVKVGMVTDNKADRIKSIVDYHNWESIFDGIAVSAEVGSGKDKMDIFHTIFQTLHVSSEECIFIDNKEENLVVPKELGVATLFFDYKKNDVLGLAREISEILDNRYRVV